MRHSDYDKIIKENFDCRDDETRSILISIDENEQNSVIASLTSKLYDSIVNKVDEIDYGTIPQSEGDITKVENYDKMLECLDIIRQYLEQYSQDTEPVEQVTKAIENVIKRKDEFEKGFKLQIEFIMVMYSNIVMAIISSISLMIQSAIEFIKEPNKDTFSISIDKVSLQKTKQSLVFNNLRKFNKSCANNKEFDNVLLYVLSNSTDHFVGGTMTGVASGIAIAAIALNIIPLLRELIFFFYHSRTSVSDYFEIQADLLQMNAYNIQNSSLKQKEKTSIVSKQMKLVNIFRKISNFIAIDTKQAEIKATKDVSASQKKYKANEIMDEKPDTASSATSLF